MHNIAFARGTRVENVYWEALKEYYDWLEKKCTLAPILGMYGFIMTAVSSWLGNLGRYEESDEISNKIMREVLRTRKFSYAQRNMYILLWNDKMQKGLPMRKEDPEWRQGLLDCLAVDNYCKDEWKAVNIKQRLGMVNEKVVY